MPRLSKKVADQLRQARDACVAAVDSYNRPGASFRTRTYVVLMSIAWTSLFHAIFYRRGRKPWYVLRGSGRGIRYLKVDGAPKTWDLDECVRQFYGDRNPPERENLKFILRLRNKIEHRHHPELDPALFGECQALLLNFEELLVAEFGESNALADNLALALQFSGLRPERQEDAVRRLHSSAAQDLLDFIQTYRAGLPTEILDSTAFSFRVFLVPKLANRKSAADLAVEFVPYDPSRPEEMDQLRHVYALVKEKRTAVASAGLMRPATVVKRVREQLPAFSMRTHTQAWKAYKVRPSGNAHYPAATRSEFCIYDELARSHGYTEAWVKHLVRRLRDPAEFDRVMSWKPG